MPASGDFNPLLPGGQGGLNPTRGQRFTELMRQQTQGSEGQPALRLCQRIKSCVGLATVGWPRDQRNLAVEGTRGAEMGRVFVQRRHTGDHGIGDLAPHIRRMFALARTCCGATFLLAPLGQVAPQGHKCCGVKLPPLPPTGFLHLTRNG